jgi:hypothetical protein
MSYNYKYIPASQAAQPAGGTDPKKQYVDLFQETLNQQFYNSSDWWNIEEETAIGSQVYQPMDVRITTLINAETGLKLGDDWKSLLFRDIDHEIELGKYYKFDNNYWLTINTEVIKNLAGTATIRRCNNTLRWLDEKTGAYYIEPCSIEYMVKEPRDYATGGSPFMTPGGFVKIFTQFNERTNLINENQRFLFGNREHWTCYKVVATGLNDFKNQETLDNSSANVLSLDLAANFVNDSLDDIVNGIADVYKNLYTLTISRDALEGAVADTFQLSAVVTYNGDTITRPLAWTSSNTTIATVSATGLVTFIKNGNCTITVNIVDNTTSDTCSVTVKATPAINNDVVLNPNINYVLEGVTQAFTVYLYEDNAIQTDTFTYSINARSVPATSYRFLETDGNHFSIVNVLRCVDSYLTITCTSGANIKAFDIYLRGAWLNDIA